MFFSEGCINISVNGKEAYSWERGLKCEEYGEIVQVGVDISEYVCNGENKILIKTTNSGIANHGRRKGINVYTD